MTDPRHGVTVSNYQASYREREERRYRNKEIYVVTDIDICRYGIGTSIKDAITKLNAAAAGLTDPTVNIEVEEDYGSHTASITVEGWRAATAEELQWRRDVERSNREYENKSKREQLARLKAELGE